MAKKKQYYCQVCGEGPFSTHQKLGGHAKSNKCYESKKKVKKKKKGKVGRPRKKKVGRPKKTTKKTTKNNKNPVTAFKVTPKDEGLGGVTIPIRIRITVEVVEE